MRTPRLPVVDWTDAPADLNGLILFVERRNLVSAHVPSHFRRILNVVLYMTVRTSSTAPALEKDHCSRFWALYSCTENAPTTDLHSILVGSFLAFCICTSVHRLFSLTTYRGADKSLARPTSRCILFDGEIISFVASLVIYINSTNIPPIMIINSSNYDNK